MRKKNVYWSKHLSSFFWLSFLCSSVPYQQGLFMATVSQGCRTSAQVTHHGHSPFGTVPLGMEHFLAQTYLSPNFFQPYPHLTFHLTCLFPSWLWLFKLVWVEVLQGPAMGWSFGTMGWSQWPWKHLWGTDTEVPKGISAAPAACVCLGHDHSKPCHYTWCKGQPGRTLPRGINESSPLCGRKPVLGKHQTRVTELTVLRSREKGNQSLEQTRQWESSWHTQLSENTLKIYFKYIIKGSPFSFKNTRHSIHDSQFMKATTLKCYKSFTTPRY